ncbi:putative integral membrane protein [Talaromyces proteolyticus]|uniref:Integral membrane protein n=1 Tax=Talaromyces proteolyticus TaxID=1131652 RepID=A0AAD4L0E2_9EURO|nr:putative integral membrane protein [Talaromyces proteolyticus]KAH8703426.1 putative integral membrane protein [Talaromyces proteolyticus]
MSASKVPEILIKKHPQQRLSSPSRETSAIIHLIGLASFSSSFKFLLDNPNYASEGYGWHFVFLTILGLALSTLTFTIAFLADITLARRLFLLKNVLSVCSAPLEVLITVLYWGIKSIDPKLVMPEEDVIPLYADLGFHLLPTLFMLFDLLYLSPPWTVTAFPAMGISSCIAFGYWFWLEQCYSINGWYPYPLLELLDTKGRIALFTVSALLMAVNTVTLKWLYGRVNDLGRVEQPKARPGDLKKPDYHE